MTEKTKFEIESVPEEKEFKNPEPLPFDFAYILSHWIVLDNMPLGLVPLGEAGIRPQAVWFLELVELEEEKYDPMSGPFMALTGEIGVRVCSVGGGEVELDSEQSADLEKVMRLIESQVKKAGHPTSVDEVIDLVGKPPKPSVISPPWVKRS